MKSRDCGPIDIVIDAADGDPRIASLEVLAMLGRTLLLGHAARTADIQVAGVDLAIRDVIAGYGLRQDPAQFRRP